MFVFHALHYSVKCCLLIHALRGEVCNFAGDHLYYVVDFVFHIVLVLVDGANLLRPQIKVNIFFQLIAFSLIPSGFQGAIFPCKNVKNRSELQF